MSDSTTSNYHFTLPAIGASQDSWGNKLNSNFTSLDGILHTITAGTGGGLPITGGTISGNLGVTGSISSNGPMATSGDLTVGGSANLTIARFAGFGDFTIYRAAPQRIFSWASGVSDTYHEVQGIRAWNTNGPLMALDNSGNLTLLLGAAAKPGGGPWSAYSDDRVKRNARPYTSGLAEIMRLEPITFEYNGKGGTKADGVTYHGLSAQAARPVMPELVFEQKPGTRDGSPDPKLLPNQLGTNLGPLTLALVNAVKELTARVAVLEARCPG
jgi:hypothetical protein